MSLNYSVYFLLRKNVLFLAVDIMDIAAEGREKGSCGERRREWGKRRCVIIIRGTSRRWIRIDNSKRVITCPIQNRCQREKCGWDTGVDVIENKRGRVGGGESSGPEESVERKRIRGFDGRVSACFHGEREDFSYGELSKHFLAEACGGAVCSAFNCYGLRAASNTNTGYTRVCWREN